MRYRVLKRRFDGAAFLADWRARVEQDKSDLKQHKEAVSFIHGSGGLVWAVPLAAGLRLFGVFEALISGARQVESTEREGTEAQLRQQLLTGRIKGTDLVQVDGGWRSFADTPLFEEVCEEAQRRNRWLTWISWSLAMALGAALFVSFIWFLFWFPRWIMTVD